MLRVGIVGYGNLGWAVEKAIYRHGEYKLIKIFSRREVKSPYGTEVERLDNISKYMGKIDIMILCVGSYKDIEKIAPSILEDFNTIDTFDTHSKLSKYKRQMDKIAKEHNKCAIIACGWDPGIMSLVRTLFDNIGEGESVSFWGKGVSQGHSNAIRRLEGVTDAIQYTVPLRCAISQANAGILPQNKHKRVCYVSVADKSKQGDIRDKIINMPNYFKGYKTTVKFVNQGKIDALKSRLYHRGYIVKSWYIAGLYKTHMKLKLTMDSNPDFTAEIVVMYLRALEKYMNSDTYGAYDVLDVPAIYLVNKKNSIDL